jgi:hypothetical protein
MSCQAEMRERERERAVQAEMEAAEQFLKDGDLMDLG